MGHFLKVKGLNEVMAMVPWFRVMDSEVINISQASSRVLAQNIRASNDIPGFRRSTMDGYAVQASSTFGASESNPAWLTIAGTISMGESPEFAIRAGEAARISTGGMLPRGADSVVMVEYTEEVDESAIEVYKSVAPLHNVIECDEDFKKGQDILGAGTLIRPQEAGLAAALGIYELPVHRIPRVGIISTGDEIVPVTATPSPGKLRDINTYTLGGLVQASGAVPVPLGIVKD
ncbi:MAG: molybdopterin molybdotransferase MoeA, partial [Desulfamplus sp.]|nr:molybdopterin molybdotransferase MoeA [Desulfamplus sp.]